MKLGKKSKAKGIAVVCLAIVAAVLLLGPNLVYQKAQLSEPFLQSFDPNSLDPTALRQQLEASDAYEVSLVPYPDSSDGMYWNLFVPDSAQHDVQILFNEGMERTGGYDYDIRWTPFPGFVLRDAADASPFYANARQAKIYCLATIASPTCTIQVHTCGDTADECVRAAEKVLLDLFRDLSAYQ